MDEPANTTEGTAPALMQRAKSGGGVLYLIGILLAVAAGVGTTYLWFTQFAPKPPERVVEKVVEKEKAEPAKFTYAPKTGGITVELPTSYLIAVRSDGENDGVTGAEFSVVKAQTTNVMVNSNTSFVNIEAYKLATTAEQEAGKIKLRYQSNGYTNVTTAASTVDGKPAVLLTANGPTDTPGPTSTYFVRGGEYLYAIKSTPGTSKADVDAVIAGTKIAAK